MYQYKCDICGCYLGQGESQTCEECNRRTRERRKAKDWTNEAAGLSEQQYEMNVEELGT